MACSMVSASRISPIRIPSGTCRSVHSCHRRTSATGLSYGDMLDRPPARLRVCAVLVTYQPDSGFAARLSRVYPQVEAVIIVDNGSSDASLSMLRELPPRASLGVMFNDENLGIACALNIGVRRA